MFSRSDNKQFFIKISENETTLILAVKKFPYHNYITDGMKEKALLDEINQETKAHPNNPASGIWSSVIDFEPIENTNLASARVNKKHRVIFVTRHIPELSKFVILLIEDDPDHNYARILNKIATGYKTKGYLCCSDDHWDLIVHAIKQKEYSLPDQFEKLRALSLHLPLTKTTPRPMKESTETENKRIENSSDDSEEVKNEMPSQEESLTTLKQVETSVNAEKESESKADEKRKNKYDRKKKNRQKQQEQQEQQDGIDFVGRTLRTIRYQLEYSEYYKTSRLANKRNTKQLFQAIKDSPFTSVAWCGMMWNVNPAVNHDNVAAMLNLGLNPNVVSSDGETLLSVAAFANEPKVIKLLLRRGTTMDLAYRNSGTVLGFAVTDLNIATGTLKLLMEEEKKKGRLNLYLSPSKQETVLHRAIRHKNVHAIYALFETGADFEIKNAEGKTALDLLTENENELNEMLKQLVSILEKDSEALTFPRI